MYAAPVVFLFFPSPSFMIRQRTDLFILSDGMYTLHQETEMQIQLCVTFYQSLNSPEMKVYHSETFFMLHHVYGRLEETHGLHKLQIIICDVENILHVKVE